MRLFQRKRTEISSAAYPESGIAIVNPGCGWYRPFIFKLHEPIDREYLATTLSASETIALVEISLEGYRDGAIDKSGRDNMRAIMNFFAEANLDIILRMTYDLDGKAMEKEPLRMEIIFSHMAAISELIEAHRDRVILMQGLFTGNWGEMHGSRFMTEHLLEELYDYFRMEFGKTMPLALRRPSYLRLLSGETLRDPYLTIFNDAILSSDTDLGTYGYSEEWKKEWRRDKELDFINKECAMRLVGGEALRPQHAIEGDVPDNETINTFERMHISYLNSQYDTKAFERWQRFPASKKAPYAKNVYEEISARLGYRFVFTKASIVSDRGRNKDSYSICIGIDNRGFASPCESLTATLRLVPSSGGESEVISAKISPDALVADIRGSINMKLPNLKSGTYDAYFAIKRSRDNASVRFANEGFESADEIPIGIITAR